MGNSLPQLPTLVMWKRVLRIRRYLRARESATGEHFGPDMALDDALLQSDEERQKEAIDLERLGEVLQALANGNPIDDEQVLWEKWGDNDPFEDFSKRVRR